MISDNMHNNELFTKKLKNLPTHDKVIKFDVFVKKILLMHFVTKLCLTF